MVTGLIGQTGQIAVRLVEMEFKHKQGLVTTHHQILGEIIVVTQIQILQPDHAN